MADLIERASAINALQHVLDSPNYSKALGEILCIPTANTSQTESLLEARDLVTVWKQKHDELFGRTNTPQNEGDK